LRQNAKFFATFFGDIFKNYNIVPRSAKAAAASTKLSGRGRGWRRRRGSCRWHWRRPRPPWSRCPFPLQVESFRTIFYPGTLGEITSKNYINVCIKHVNSFYFIDFYSFRFLDLLALESHKIALHLHYWP
jgi:hypothetical protein